MDAEWQKPHLSRPAEPPCRHPQRSAGSRLHRRPQHPNCYRFHPVRRAGHQPQFTNPTQANPKVNYTFIKGRHSLKVGYEYGWLSQAISDFHPKFGQDTYSGQYSSTTGIASGGVTRQAANNLADFLFGARSNYALNAVNEVNYLRQWHMGYLQDDWKALPNLTINAGLRYEFMSPNYEQNNKILNFDPVNQQLFQAGAGTDVNSTTHGHVYKIHYVGGSSLADRALVNPDYKDFGPRLGFSYQALPGTVLRGGFGISYAYLFRFGGEGLLAYNGPNNCSATLPVAQAPTQPLCTSLTQDPTTCFRRTQDGYQTNFAGPSNFTTTRAQTRYTPQNFENGYVEAFHLSVQQQLPLKTTLEVAYVGNHAVHIAALEDFNQARLCTAAEITSKACTSTGSASLLNRRPIPNFTDILTESNAGFLTYNSLQTKLERRLPTASSSSIRSPTPRQSTLRQPTLRRKMAIPPSSMSPILQAIVARPATTNLSTTPPLSSQTFLSAAIAGSATTRLAGRKRFLAAGSSPALTLSPAVFPSTFPTPLTPIRSSPPPAPFTAFAPTLPAALRPCTAVPSPRLSAASPAT